MAEKSSIWGGGDSGKAFAEEAFGRVMVTPKYFSYYAAPAFSLPCLVYVCLYASVCVSDCITVCVCVCVSGICVCFLKFKLRQTKLGD